MKCTAHMLYHFIQHFLSAIANWLLLIINWNKKIINKIAQLSSILQGKYIQQKHLDNLAARFIQEIKPQTSVSFGKNLQISFEWNFWWQIP